MDKEKIIEEINNLPLFELIDVGIRKNEKDDYVKQEHTKSVVFVGKTDSLAYVSANRYKLFQFKEIFMPIVKKINVFDGVLKNFLGRCLLEIKPDQEEFKDNDTEYGLTIVNSVDKSTSIIVKFNVRMNGNTLCFPKSIAMFSQTHSNKGLEISKDYVEMVLKVKTAWRNIIKHFPTIKIPTDDYDGILDNFSLSKTTRKTLKHDHKWKGVQYTLWDVVEIRLKEISGKEYRSEVHKSEALNKLCNKIFTYSVAVGI